MQGAVQRLPIISFFSVVILLLLSSCEDCYKCGIDQPEPYFNVKFYNATLLSSVNEEIERLDESRTALRTTLQDLNEQLRELPSDAPEEQREALLALIQETEDDIADNAADKSHYSSIKSTIESGAVFIRQVTSAIGKSISFTNEHSDSDSLTAFSLPLPMAEHEPGNPLTARYEITMVPGEQEEDKVYTLEVQYTTELVTEHGAVVFKAYNLKDTYSTFDSVKVHPENNLGNTTNETYLYLYF